MKGGARNGNGAGGAVECVGIHEQVGSMGMLLLQRSIYNPLSAGPWKKNSAWKEMYHVSFTFSGKLHYQIQDDPKCPPP